MTIPDFCFSSNKCEVFRGKVGEDGEVFENVCENDCEGVHANIHYTVHKEGVFKMKMRS